MWRFGSESINITIDPNILLFSWDNSCDIYILCNPQLYQNMLLLWNLHKTYYIMIISPENGGEEVRGTDVVGKKFYTYPLSLSALEPGLKYF